MRILVIGDVMLDKYVVGRVNRISPEAPVPVVQLLYEYKQPGGASNVARNLIEYDADVDIITILGDDENGKYIKKYFSTSEIIALPVSCTITKTRIMAGEGEHQLLRVDEEEDERYEHDDKYLRIIRSFLDNRRDYDAFIVSDYAKGTITAELMQILSEYSTKLIIDPKPSNYKLYKKDIFAISPNRTELDQMLHNGWNHTSALYILETLGKEGILLIDNSEDRAYKIKVPQVSVYNVSGAGDVVISVFTYCVCSGIKPKIASKIAAICATGSVSEIGTGFIKKAVLDKVIEDNVN